MDGVDRDQLLIDGDQWLVGGVSIGISCRLIEIRGG